MTESESITWRQAAGYLNGLLTPALLGGLGWLIMGVGDLKTEVATLRNQIASRDVIIELTVKQLDERLQNRVETTDLHFKRIRAELEGQIAVLVSRVEKLETNEKRVWPRIRSLNQNVLLIAKAFSDKHGETLPLTEPEAY